MQGQHPSAPGHYSHSHGPGTSRRTLQRRRKTVDAADQETNQGRGKDVERKSQKTDFPFQLANPANYARFALYHRLDGHWRLTKLNRTFHLFSKADIFTC